MSDKPTVPYVGYKMPKHFGYVEIKTPEGEVYMRRWYLFMCRKFSIRLHHIMRPDLDTWPHNHPWEFISFIIRGGYKEAWCLKDQFEWRRKEVATEDGGFIGGEPFWSPARFKLVRRFSYHHWDDFHKIKEFLRGDKGAWTLVITGSVKHTWGFLTDQGFFTHKDLGVGNVSDTNP